MTNEIRELNLNELESVSGGMDPLHLLAQVAHMSSSDAGVRLEDVAAGAGTKAPARKIN